MQPTGWNRQSGPTAPPPPPGWGDHAPGFGNPPPTWGAAAGPAPTAVDDAGGPRRIGATVAAHVVLWGGLALVAVARPAVVDPLARANVPYWLYSTVSSLLLLVPVTVALVCAGRSAVLRLTGLVAALVVAGVVLSYGFRTSDLPSYPWVLSIATYVLGLGAWMAVRRHALWGLLLLILFAALLLVWTGPGGPQLSGLLVRERITQPVLLTAWTLVPVVVAGAFGLVSSLLRPQPGRSTDGVGLAVTGGLVVLVVLAFGLTFVG